MFQATNHPVCAAIRCRALVVGLLVLIGAPSFAEEAAPQASAPRGNEAVALQASAPNENKETPLQISRPIVHEEAAPQASTPKGNEAAVLQASAPIGNNEAAPQVSTPNVNGEAAPQASAPKGNKEATPQVSAPNGNAALTLAAMPDPAGKSVSHYRLQPGDVLQISVWKETDLQSDVLIRPDGGFSFPLVGDFDVVGKTIEQLRTEFTQRIQRFVPDALVSISLKQPQGHRVYVVGRVNRPGEYPAVREVDVMQALSMAGGATPFASLNSIRVLRRVDGKQQVFKFRYSDIENGKDLEQNITLQGGDVVVVP